MSENSYEALSQRVEGDPILAERLRRLWPLAFFATYSILPPGYEFPSEIDTAIVLSPQGIIIQDKILALNLDFRSADIKSAILGKFYGQDLYIDLERTDCEGILRILSEEVATCRIRYPFVHGRQLYDKYYDVYRSNRVTPSVEGTQNLLQDTPQGVFQVGNIVSGPYGLLQSSVSRLIAPTTNAPLAHCKNTDCQSIHGVQLMTGDTSAGSAFKLINQFEALDIERIGHWQPVLVDLILPAEVIMSDFYTGELIWLIGNALSDSELTSLLCHLIDSYPELLRRTLSDCGEDCSRSASEISKRLGRSHALQIFSVLSDQMIAISLEELVKTNKVQIPETETRRAPFRGSASRGFFGQRAELSRLGLRFVSQPSHLAMMRLKSLIKKLHTADELSWQFLESRGTTLDEKLDEMVYNTDLKELVDRLLLHSRELYEGTRDYFSYSPIASPTTLSGREELIEEVIWKLGFQVPTFPLINETLWKRVANLRDAISSLSSESEDSVELVRGIGSSTFATLEEVLDRALSFSTWSLLSDHYGRPRVSRFKYLVSEARIKMADELSNRLMTDGSTIEFSTTGKNSLFGLVHGFTVLSDRCKEILEMRDDERWIRKPEDSPKWIDKTAIMPFPFRHVIPILDLSSESVEQLLEAYRKVTRILVAGDVMSIRNRFQHGGRIFPNEREISIALTAIEEAIEILEVLGAVPLVFVPTRRTLDGYKRGYMQMEDYKGRQVLLLDPSEFMRCDLPDVGTAQVIFTGARIASSSECLRFVFQELSGFTEMWSNYPRGRSALDHESGDVVDTTLGIEGEMATASMEFS